MYFHLLQYSGDFYMRNKGMLFTCEVNMIITVIYKVVNTFLGKKCLYRH